MTEDQIPDIVPNNADWDRLGLKVARQLHKGYRLGEFAGWNEDQCLALIDAAASDATFLAYLENTINADLLIERAMCRLRHTLLAQYCSAGTVSLRRQRFAAALAQQCFNNEYVYEPSDWERAELKTLKASLKKYNVDCSAVLVCSLYEPLYKLPKHIVIRLKMEAPWLAPFVLRTYEEPVSQRMLANSLPSRPIVDGVSSAVRSMYEESPYPRWLSVPEATPEPIEECLKRDFPHFTPPQFLRAPFEMLAAGCGTGRQVARFARMYQGINVLAVDLSRASIGYAAFMAKKLGNENIRFLQADILDLPSLGRLFPFIDCAGVLHHMADPLAGWRALTECLMPGGVMQIGLYGETGRAVIARLRERVKAQGLENATPDQIRTFRAKLIESNDPELPQLLCRRDFFTVSEFRDLVFHVAEQRYTPGQIRAMLDSLGLRFLGFLLPPDSHLLALYRARYPDDPMGLDLDNWHSFEREVPEIASSFYYFGCQKPLD
jgi:SAM-dependent methyltransferase